MNSKQSIVSDKVTMPQYFYLNTKDDTTGENTYKSKFDTAIDSSCVNVDSSKSIISTKPTLTDGSYEKLMYDSIKKTNADEVTALAAAGLLEDKDTKFDTNQNNIQNQVKYLACQVLKCMQENIVPILFLKMLDYQI